MDKVRSATKEQLVRWFREYMKRGQVDNAKIISDEIRKRRIGETEETKTPPVMVTNSMLSEGDIERIISEHTL